MGERETALCEPGQLAREAKRGEGRVKAPAPGLPPQSFGENTAWLAWEVLCAFALVLVEGIMAARWAFVLDGRFVIGDFLFPIVVYRLVAALAWIFPATWMAGADGWLMLLSGCRSRAWVRTSRLVHVGAESTGEGYQASYLTLRDDEGRELRMPVKKLTAEAAASLLAGVRRSPGADLAGPSSRAAVAALELIAQSK